MFLLIPLRNLIFHGVNLAIVNDIARGEVVSMDRFTKVNASILTPRIVPLKLHIQGQLGPPKPFKSSY